MKKADFQCLQCESFVYFCAACDGYVHSLPSKRNHHRTLLEGNASSRLERREQNEFRNEIRNNEFRNDLRHDYSNDRIRDQEGELRENYEKISKVDNSINFMTNVPNYTDNYTNFTNVSYNHAKNTHYEPQEKLEILNNINNANLNNTLSLNQSKLSITNSPNTHPSASNYLNEIKKIYDQEKDELVNKTLYLEKNLDLVKGSMNERLFHMQKQLDETTKKYHLNMQLMDDEHRMDYKKLQQEKENEIKILQNQNLELQKSNEELLQKINEYSKISHDLKNNLNEQISNFEFDLKKREHDFSDMKKHYENRIEYLTESFSEEKSKLINNYEKSIEKLNIGYKESKEKFLSLINEKDSDYNALVEKSKIEER